MDDLRALSAAKKAAGAVAEHERELRRRHAERRQKRLSVHSAMRPMEEVLRNASCLVDEAAAKWTADFGETWTRSISGYVDVVVDNFGNMKERTRAPRFPDSRTLDFGMLCALAPDVLKAALHGMIRAKKSETFGLSEADRAARLGVLDAEITEIERLHAELVDGAAAVGITLPRLVRIEDP